MKKTLSLILVLSLVFSMLAIHASALDYKWRLENEATFETMGEVKVNMGRAPAALAAYPDDFTYVYRSADLYGVTAASRLNTSIVVFCGTQFESKDDAFAYLQGLGLIDIIDAAVGNIVLVTPSTPVTEGSSGKSGGTFAAIDAYNYYLLQTAQYNSNNYFGAFGYRYVIAIDEGATFFNNYIAPVTDFIGRIAGVLLIGGTMDTLLYHVGCCVPAYLVNAPQNVFDAYAAANGADVIAHNDTIQNGVEYAYNQQFPLRMVSNVAVEDLDCKNTIEKIYYNRMIKVMRIPVQKDGIISVGTQYAGYGNDDAPYSLAKRDAIIGGLENGKTQAGINVIWHKEDRFDKEGLVSKNDVPRGEEGSVYEFLETWWELLPDEVLNNTAPEHSVPLWLANHGGGDDPVQFVDEIGLLALAAEENFAIVAPYYQSMYSGFGGAGDPVPMCNALDALVEYMLETYPALDPARVYVTGYSLGGGATLHALFGNPALFAAAIPMSAAWYAGNEEQQAAFETVDLPILMTTSTYDLGGAFSSATMQISTAYQENGMNAFLRYNGMEPITFDFDAYELSGFKGDLYRKQTLNGEYVNYMWFQCREDGAPMVGVAYTETLKHALYPEFGKLAWDWCKYFSRNQETGEIEYNR